MTECKPSLPTIRRAVATLPKAEESTSYGTPAWRCRGRILARPCQDGASIVHEARNETRVTLLRASPETFFITNHYAGCPIALTRLHRLSAADLIKLILRAMKTKRSRRYGLGCAPPILRP